jgi:K+-transporting ATPase ATPase A chain
MGPTAAGVVFIVSLVLALAVSYRPLGDYMAKVYRSERHLSPERWIYHAAGVSPDTDQPWGAYLRSALAFSAVSVLGLYLLLRLQGHLPESLGFAGMHQSQAFNTAASFTTNTNWQSYSGESALGYTAQMAGLAVQNFVSSAVGIAVAIALVRGFARSRTDRLGNFWVDLVRTCVRILLPISLVAAIVLVAGGAIENFHSLQTITTLAGGKQSITGGPVASQEAIKQLGTNGGGFYNANSAHPFENPTAWTNWVQIYLMLVIAFSLPRTFGRLVGDRRQGLAIVAVMGVLFLGSVTTMNIVQNIHHGTVPASVGAATEGTEQRFGVPDSATFAASTTLTSSGAVDSFHRLGSVRHARPGRHHRLRRRPHGRADAGVPTQEDLGAGDEVRVAVFPDDADVRPGRHGHRDGAAGRACGDAEQRRPWLLRGAVRLHFRRQQQRVRVRRPGCEHDLVQHCARPGDARRPLHPHDLRARAGWLARPSAARPGV